MATAKSIISVAFLGDAKNLLRTIGTVDSSLGGALGSAAKLLAGAAIVDKGFDAIQSMIDSADRAGDATARIASLLGDVDTQKLTDIADDFADIGVSAPDFLEIAAGFSEFAAASGKIDPDTITGMAGGVVEFAGAMGRLKDVDPATLGDDISNFIAGTRGAAAAAKELGVPFDDALTPAQRYAQLMERLPGLIDAVTGANAGLDDKQSKLQARWETLGSEVGPEFEEVLSNILQFILDEIDALPHAIEGFKLLGKAIEDFGRNVLGPLGNVRDVLESIVNLFGQTNGAGLTGGVSSHGGGLSGGTSHGGSISDSGVGGAVTRNADRNGITRDRIGGP